MNAAQLTAIKVWGRHYHLNESTVAAKGVPSDSEIDAEVEAWAAVTRLVSTPAPQEHVLPVAWRTETTSGQSSYVTERKEIADRWAENGFDVTPLFSSPPAPKTSAHVHGGMPADLKTSAALMNLIEAAKTKLKAMTPEEQQAMWQAQRESWVRGEMQLDRTDTPAPPAPNMDDEVPFHVSRSSDGTREWYSARDPATGVTIPLDTRDRAYALVASLNRAFAHHLRMGTQTPAPKPEPCGYVFGGCTYLPSGSPLLTDRIKAESMAVYSEGVNGAPSPACKVPRTLQPSLSPGER